MKHTVDGWVITLGQIKSDHIYLDNGHQDDNNKRGLYFLQ